MFLWQPFDSIVSPRADYLERASSLIFKDAVLRDLVIAMKLFVHFSNEHQSVPPVNHQQICLITEFVVFSREVNILWFKDTKKAKTVSKNWMREQLNA